MVNEFTYCQRLFFLEWVQARFEDNPDTVDGRYQHRVVDAGGGRAPDAEDQADLKVARSVMLSSPELGVVGRIDLLEGDGGTVVPVDYKRGTPPATAARAWDPERVQVCVLGLLLRANGYRCHGGVLWFAETRERVEVAFDDALVLQTQRLLDELRVVAGRDLAPPPLVDSPKCPRCSLVGICLPDEHNALVGRPGRQPRRLVPRDSEARPLYVTEAGTTVGVRDGRIEVRKKDQRLSSVRLVDVSQVTVFGNVQVTTQALRECFAREVPVSYLSYGGWLQGVSLGLPSKHVELRRRQVVVASSNALEAARLMVEGKIRNSRTLLRRNGRPAPEAALATLGRLRRIRRRGSLRRFPPGLRGRGGPGLLRCAALDASSRAGASGPGVLLRRKEPPPPRRCIQLPAFLSLRPSGQGPSSHDSRRRLRPVPWPLPPPSLRSACAGARPGRGVPAPRGRFCCHQHGEQR